MSPTLNPKTLHKTVESALNDFYDLEALEKSPLKKAKALWTISTTCSVHTLTCRAMGLQYESG